MKKFLILFLFIPHFLLSQTLCVQVNCKRTIQLPQDSVYLNSFITTTDSVTEVSWGADHVVSISDVDSNTMIVRGLKPGTYVFNLIVTTKDNLAQAAFDTVVVLPAPLPPVVTATATQLNSIAGINDTLIATATDPNNQGITKYGWGKLAGPGAQIILNANQPTCIITGLQVGIYQFKVTAWNAANLTAGSVVILTVNPPSTTSKTIQKITILYSVGSTETKP